MGKGPGERWHPERQAEAAGYGNAHHLERQRLLLQRMLRVALAQRDYLISGDTKRVARATRLLGELLERQVELHREFPGFQGRPDLGKIERVRRLADRLREESRTNHLLACRGTQFADLWISLLQASPEPSLEGQESGRPGLVRLVDGRG